MDEWTQGQRVFKTAWFAKMAKKHLISDSELRNAALEVMRGQADDLGGGVFKKRLNRNMHRSIVVAKGRRYWIFAYLFAKRIGQISTTRNSPRSGSLRHFTVER
ncbi:hypothetical protein J2X57_003081 [Luteibacter sp. 1214]|uniref:type II toxin-antitoxin system RelE/ParE family toxin n=1 Tax=Luteibacter sp. 1214 TaxID=2817735 RepID=UPI0028548BB0|nr:type II toxin-antitoxin system RelE/ParE family toxin [Luteibacter sp. 1214]MDR6643848.1 hypothetical protein [Luteibacter sp. 1214]